MLQEQGYKYTLDWTHDDQPVWMKTRSGGRILSVPYSQEINDIPAIIARQASASDFAGMIIDQFDEMLEQATSGPPLVLGIALHPYIVGQPYRLRHLKRALRHIAAAAKGCHTAREAMQGSEPDRIQQQTVWLTTAGAIADFIMTEHPETIPGSDNFDPDNALQHQQ